MNFFKSGVLALLLLGNMAVQGQDWKPAGDKISTPWAALVDPASPLPEYPRPQLVRQEWMNLNGLWDYAIRPAGQAIPSTFDGPVLVPFAVELFAWKLPHDWFPMETLPKPTCPPADDAALLAGPVIPETIPDIATSPPLTIARAIIGTLIVSIPAMASAEIVVFSSWAALTTDTPSTPAKAAFNDLAPAIVPT